MQTIQNEKHYYIIMRTLIVLQVGYKVTCTTFVPRSLFPSLPLFLSPSSSLISLSPLFPPSLSPFSYMPLPGPARYDTVIESVNRAYAFSLIRVGSIFFLPNNNFCCLADAPSYSTALSPI